MTCGADDLKAFAKKRVVPSNMTTKFRLVSSRPGLVAELTMASVGCTRSSDACGGAHPIVHHRRDRFQRAALWMSRFFNWVNRVDLDRSLKAEPENAVQAQ